MKIVFFMLIFILNIKAQAHNFEELRQKLFFHKSSAQEFLKLRQQLFIYENLLEICRNQWSEKQIPWACYLLIENNMEIKNQNLSFSRISDLDQRCLEISMKETQQEHLTRILGRLKNNESCKQHIQRQITKLKYIQKMARNLP